MSAIVVQMDLGPKGGGEAVCMNVLEALQDNHEVTLPTLTEPNLDELNAYFNTDVRDIVVERAGVLALWLHERYGLQYYILQNALLDRYARSRLAVRTAVPDSRHRTGRPSVQTRTRHDKPFRCEYDRVSTIDGSHKRP